MTPQFVHILIKNGHTSLKLTGATKLILSLVSFVFMIQLLVPSVRVELIKIVYLILSMVLIFYAAWIAKSRFG